MSSDETILEEMLERATNPEKDSDELSVQMFCIVVRSNANLVHKAQEILIQKIRSNNTVIALKAISLLGECMSKGGTDFQDEAAKFRFLNELIRLVSTKYQGAETPNEIKQRIMESLLLWTTEFPRKTKIREAYEMLYKEGNLDKNCKITANATKKENVLGIDEEMLAKLIKSENPENLKKANLLIQYRVNQEARKTELLMQHKSELQEIRNTISLLTEMLNTHSETDVDAAETMKELYKNCKKHKPILKRMPELLDNTDEALIADTLEVNDALQAVMTRYNTLQGTLTRSKNAVQPSVVEIQAPSSEINTATNSSTELLSDIFNDVLNSKKEETNILKNPSNNQNLQELNDIFGTFLKSEEEKPIESIPSKIAADLFGSPTCLQPAKVYNESKVKEESPEESEKKFPEEKKRAFNALEEIDKLSEELLKQNLNKVDIVIPPMSKETKKPSLNDLVKENSLMLGSPMKVISKNVAITDLSPSTEPVKPENNEIEEMKSKEESVEVVEEKETASSLPIVHLSDISLDLDEVTPASEERIVLDDSDLQIGMVFCEDRPSKNVTVIVLQASNKSKQEIKDFQIEASVKKPAKVRLLQASDTFMPAKKPFRQTIPINQILLLLNPTGKAVDITLLAGYKMGDDPDAIKESFVIKNIPYVD